MEKLIWVSIRKMVVNVRLVCEFCQTEFKNTFILKTHLAKKHAFCFICKAKSEKKEIFEHFKNHSKCVKCTKKQRCANCYFSARILTSLKNQNSGKWTVKIRKLEVSKCKICLKPFADQKDLENHQKKIHEEKWTVALTKWKETKTLQIICQLCQKIHHKFSDYEIHFLTHFQIGNECKKCKNQKNSVDDVKSHIFEKHEKFTPPLIKCFNKCQFATRSLAIFQHHCQLEGHEKIEEIEENSKVIQKDTKREENINNISIENIDIENKENIPGKKIKKICSTPKMRSKKSRNAKILRF